MPMPTSTTSAPSAAKAPDGERSRSRARTRRGSGGERGSRRRPRRRPRRATRPSGLLRTSPQSPGLPTVILPSSGRSAERRREARTQPTGLESQREDGGPNPRRKIGLPRPGRLEIPGGHPRIFPGCQAGNRPHSSFPQRRSEPGLRGRSPSWPGPRAERREGGAGCSLAHRWLRGSGRLRPLRQPAGTQPREVWGHQQQCLQGKSCQGATSPPHVAAP